MHFVKTILVATAVVALPQGEIEIVGGVPVSSQTVYPWIGSVSISGSKHSCGGTLLTPTVFMTAGHCSEGSASSRKVTVWRYDLSKSTAAEGAVTFDVVKILTHPNFTNANGYRSTNTVPLNDISLWVLKQTGNTQNRVLQFGTYATNPLSP